MDNAALCVKQEHIHDCIYISCWIEPLDAFVHQTRHAQLPELAVVNV